MTNNSSSRSDLRSRVFLPMHLPAASYHQPNRHPPPNKPPNLHRKSRSHKELPRVLICFNSYNEPQGCPKACLLPTCLSFFWFPSLPRRISAEGGNHPRFHPDLPPRWVWPGARKRRKREDFEDLIGLSTFKRVGNMHELSKTTGTRCFEGLPGLPTNLRPSLSMGLLQDVGCRDHLH